MSKNSGGYMGVQIGKLGPAVGSMWKGKNVYRAYTPFVRNPRTEKQMIHRTIFGTISKLAQKLSGAVNRGFGYLADTQHNLPRALFVKANFPHVHCDTPGSATVDYEDLLLASGPVTPAIMGTPAYSDSTHKVMVPIANSMSGLGLSLDSDNVLVVLFCPDNPLAVMGRAVRTATAVEIDVPAQWESDAVTVHVYAFTITTVDEPTFVESYDGYAQPGMSSDSVYLGSLTIS